MVYFDVLVDKLQCHFLRIKVPITAQTSVTRQIIVCITMECSLFGMSELNRLTDRIRNFVYILCQ